jgi:hypothetical protein
MSLSRPSLALTLMAALALFVMGCAATAASSTVPGVLLLVAALSLGVQGCFLSDNSANNSPPETLNNLVEPRDMGSDLGGSWETCCDGDGKLSSCFCPEGAACNYGWFERCDPERSAGGIECSYFGENSCGYTDVDMAPDMEPDMDMGGAWEPCCENGKISACFCPEGAACNYGWFTSCDPATSTGGVECVFGGPDACIGDVQDMAPDMVEPDMEPDMGPDKDMGGTWEPCCQGGQLSTCHCPEGAACNYGWFAACDPAQSPAVECALTEDQCGYAGEDMGPDMKPDMGGTWDPCCINGVISTCHCPEGAACNYGFTACDPATSGGVACVLPGAMCPVTM